MSSVISIGHISTIALAAAMIGFMTASVTGLGVIQGTSNDLDTVLPSAWTSDLPQLVGLCAQRMGTF
jgi:MATE family multidrug resistance protein